MPKEFIKRINIENMESAKEFAREKCPRPYNFCDGKVVQGYDESKDAKELEPCSLYKGGKCKHPRRGFGARPSRN